MIYVLKGDQQISNLGIGKKKPGRRYLGTAFSIDKDKEIGKDLNNGSKGPLNNVKCHVGK